MTPSSINPEYFENWIQYFRQTNIQMYKEEKELEERVNTLAEAIVITEEKLENLHEANDELESKIKQIRADIHGHDYQSNTLKVISILFFGFSFITSVGIYCYNYSPAIFDYSSVTNINGGV